MCIFQCALALIMGKILFCLASKNIYDTDCWQYKSRMSAHITKHDQHGDIHCNYVHHKVAYKYDVNNQLFPCVRMTCVPSCRQNGKKWLHVELFNSLLCTFSLILTFRIMYTTWCFPLYYCSNCCWTLSIHKYFNFILMPFYHSHTLLS